MQPLAGIRILDLSRLLPGPFATLVLADLGATVDKLEDSEGGDYLRHMPPTVGDTSSMFLALNRNKRSVCVDLKKAGASELVLAMLPTYDVVLDQFRPGVLDRLDLSHAAMLRANPRLVVCALTGFGQVGPLRDRAGHDINYLARSGVLGLSGPTNAPPATPGFQLADVGGALWTVIGILAKLRERETSGAGGVVDIAMTDVSLGFAIASLGLAFGGQTPVRGAEALTGGLAVYGTYETKDGRAVAFGALEPKFWANFCRGVGRPTDMDALIAGPHQTLLRAELETLFRTRTRDEWNAFALQHEACLEGVVEPGEIHSDPHHVARETFFDMASPWGILKQWRTPLAPVDKVHTPPPRQGEHTAEILRAAGISSEEIERLRLAKVIR